MTIRCNLIAMKTAVQIPPKNVMLIFILLNSFKTQLVQNVSFTMLTWHSGASTVS